MTKAAYKNGKEKLRVYAVSDAAPTAQLTVSIEGFVEVAVMTYNANKDRYEYKVSTSVNVDGAQVTVVSDLGGQASQTIQ